MSVFRLEKTSLPFSFEQTAGPVNVIASYAKGLPNLGFCTKPMTDQIAEKEPKGLKIIFAMGIHRQTIEDILNKSILFIDTHAGADEFCTAGKNGKLKLHNR